jgi:DNA-binding LacI/PurR family transcriptional regulator
LTNSRQRKDFGQTQPKNGRLTIGLSIDDIVLVGGRNALRGFVDAAQERDLNLICFHQLICQRDADAPPEMGPATWDSLSNLVDGLILYQTWPDEESFVEFRHRFPLLPMVNALRLYDGCPGLAPDSYLGANELTRHLIEVHGYRRIVFAAGPDTWSVHERYRGYADALAENNLPLDPRLVTPHCSWGEAGRGTPSLLLDEYKLVPGTDFDAVVSANDGIALPLMNELRNRGMRVPDDVAIVGFDDEARSSSATPPLTTARLPAYEMGRKAVELVLAQLAGEQVPDQTLVPARIMLRRSCGCMDPVVVQAAIGPVKDVPRKITLEEALTSQSSKLISEITQVVGDQGEGSVSKWAEQMVNSFATEMTAKAFNLRFLSTLEDVLSQVMAVEDASGVNPGQYVAAWQGALSVLRRNVLPYLNGDTTTRAEDLWQQANIMMGKAAHHAYERRALAVEEQTQVLRQIEAALLTTFNINELMNILAEGLPRLGILSCYLSVYENPASYQDPHQPPEWSRLIMACNESGRIDLEADGLPFRSAQLVPDGMTKQDGYKFMVEPLYLRENQLGFVLFGMGTRESSVYGLLRQGVSSALLGALLMEQEEKRAHQLQTVAEVSTATSTILDTADLLQQVVDLTKERF